MLDVSIITRSKRILILGSAGAGKSTLARQLGNSLKLPAVPLDKYFWKPGWVEPDRDQFREVVAALAAADVWVMDGNYSSTLDLRLPRADAVILLNFPRRLSYWRILKRRIRYHGKTRPDLAEGCSEQIDIAFVKWIWSYPHNRMPKLLEIVEQGGACNKTIVLRKPTEVAALLRTVEKDARQPADRK